LFSGAALVQAQTLESVELGTGTDSASVVNIRFNGSMRFLAQLPAGPSTRFTLRAELLNGDESVLRQVIAETRRLAGSAGVPALSVTYEPESRSRTRQVLLEFERSVLLQARQGTSSRSIELVVRPVDKALLRFGVLLESLPLAQRNEAKPIPPQLQGFEINSLVVGYPDGQRVDVVVGYFASREEAEAVRTLARVRYPRCSNKALRQPNRPQRRPPHERPQRRHRPQRQHLGRRPARRRPPAALPSWPQVRLRPRSNAKPMSTCATRAKP
jgi:hypothetical protein